MRHVTFVAFFCEAWCLILFYADLLNLVSIQKYGWVLYLVADMLLG